MRCNQCNKDIQESAEKPQKCPFCASLLLEETFEEEEIDASTSEAYETFFKNESSYVSNLAPNPDEIQFTIGSYQVIKLIGQGGMGEVYLAFDPSCGRQIALKRIRYDLKEHKNLERRFIKEAKITSQLTHPSIIPIYQIHQGGETYYTMPFVQGETLKEILRNAKAQEQTIYLSEKTQYSIPSLVRVFLSLCQAIAYAHSHGVLHRDIKPENVIVGPFGEVLILDWGLAKMISSSEKDPQFFTKEHSAHEITRGGKVVGTVNYMAPERALGSPATIQTDIYSLGVILYQILALRSPFRRGTLSEFKKKIHKEALPDPAEIAPYREVPSELKRIVERCLDKSSEKRYATVHEMVRDVESFIEGRADWFLMSSLDVADKAMWEFQEHVLITEHTAVTRSSEMNDWVNLMISKDSFSKNMKIEADITLHEGGQGIGFMLSIPEPQERKHINDGYCLWLGSDINRTTMLLRSTVEVMAAPEVYLKQGKTYRVRIEKLDQRIYFYLNDAFQFSYISHIPLSGTHIGILSRDGNYKLEQFHVYVGSLNIMVNCLAVPDAFLAHKDYHTALIEYRRIAYSFPGRAEGREALFKAGITLLEEGKNSANKEKAREKFELALMEFEKLHDTPGAPLEYLGKGLVYQALEDFEEEAKCYELAIRRYKGHPLLPVLQEQVIWRMHESSRTHRKSAYRFILLATRQLPDHLKGRHSRKLFSNLMKHWEPLYFMKGQDDSETSSYLKDQNFAISLAFWLAKPHTLVEIVDDLKEMYEPPLHIIENAFFALLELGATSLASDLEVEDCLKKLVSISKETLPSVFDECKEIKDARLQTFLLNKSLEYELVLPFEIHKDILSAELIDCATIQQALLQQNLDKALALFSRYSLDEILNPRSQLNWLYGCFLWAAEGKEIALIHFEGFLDEPFPQTPSLLSHYLRGKISQESPWYEKSFLMEKKALFRQLIVFYQTIGDEESLKSAKRAKNALMEDFAVYV